MFNAKTQRHKGAIQTIKAAVAGAMCAALVLMTFGALAYARPAASFFDDPKKDFQQPFASAARGTTTSAAFQVYEANCLVAWLTVSAKSAGATSLDVKLQDSVDGTNFADVPGGSFSQVTGATSSQRLTVLAVPGRYFQVVGTVGGSSTPTFTYHVETMAFRMTGGLNIQSTADAATLTGTLATGRLSEDVARTTSVTVATAAVLLLHTTPVALVAAPGAGKVILIDEITAKLVFNSVAYTGSNALEFRYTDGSGAKVTADIASSFINSASGTNYATVKSVVTALTPVANAAVVVAVPTADPGAGNSAIVFTVKYRIVTP